MSFWSQFERAYCLPDACNCELVRDAFISQPSAFWSSFSYIIFALILFFRTKEKDFAATLWTSSFIILGIGSCFAHLSFIEFAMALDFAAIILVISFFIVLKLLKSISESQLIITLLFLFYFIVLWLGFYSLDKWTKIGLCVLIFTFALSELYQSLGRSFFKSKSLQTSFVLIVSSFIIYLIDDFKIFCEPESLFQGHSLWHIGTSLGIYYYGNWRLNEHEGRV